MKHSDNPRKYLNQIDFRMDNKHDSVENYLFCPQNSLFASFQSSEITNQKQQIKKTKNSSLSTLQNNSFINTQRSIDRRKQHFTCQIGLQNIQGKCFPCFSDKTESCDLWQGSKNLEKKSMLINFFSYIVQYKLGIVQSYTSELQRELTVSQKYANKKQNLNAPQIINQLQNIHFGYFCNKCNNYSAIKGTRYTCQKCQDFDLCEKCFENFNHPHIMIKIEESPQYKSRRRFFQRLSTKTININAAIRKTFENYEKLQRKMARHSVK